MFLQELPYAHYDLYYSVTFHIIHVAAVAKTSFLYPPLIYITLRSITSKSRMKHIKSLQVQDWCFCMSCLIHVSSYMHWMLTYMEHKQLLQNLHSCTQNSQVMEELGKSSDRCTSTILMACNVYCMHITYMVAAIAITTFLNSNASHPKWWRNGANQATSARKVFLQ